MHRNVHEAKGGEVMAATCASRVRLDFSKDCVANQRPTVNNLGGNGPDTGVPEQLRFNNVAHHNGHQVDLVVTALNAIERFPDSYEAPYDHGYSGCYGSVGYVNIKSGTQTRMRFSFKNHATGAPVTLPAFTIGVLDIGGNGKERITVTGHTSFTTRIGSTNVVSLHNGTFESCHKTTTCKYPPAQCPGSTCPTRYDNPRNPTNLTEVQKAAAIRFNFDTPTSNFTMTWGKLESSADAWPSRMFFAGEIEMDGACLPPKANGQPAFVPLATPGDEPFSDSPVCTPSGSNRVTLNFSRNCNAQGGPAINNLAGQGPETGVPPILRFNNVTHWNGKVVDCKVEALTALTRYPISGNLPHDNGYSGCYDSVSYVNLQQGSTVRLRFTFVDHATNNAIELPGFSILSLDVGGSGLSRVTMHGYSNAHVWSGGSNIVNLHNGTYESCEKMTTCVYPPDLCPGYNCPVQNPNPPATDGLSSFQKAHAIRFDFDKGTSNFTVEWGKSAPLQPWPSRFFFSGSMNMPGVCDTRPPSSPSGILP
jgi:hypothetical protein